MERFASRELQVRFARQSTGERNFHIFYQLTAGADEEERKAWHLLQQPEYQLINQSGCYTIEYGAVDWL